MSTLMTKTPIKEVLNGVLYKSKKITGEKEDIGTPFKYRNFTEDSITEQQPLKGMHMNKLSNVIYTSSPIKFSGSDVVRLEDQPNDRKVKFVDYDNKRSKETDRRLIGIGDEKFKFLSKIVYLE
jgi:hypothetical protein